ncbi:alveolar macrophage chemotactic factor-like [Carassius carassius]|uniref:alveolar macrophage chemotactic factor-like n=1 Tax=Carassius carassius TaxID=217509 RepID=UPI0028689840|nr:alveolar macrophage chemotactic factor-like [Carassius carassius]
MSLLSYLLLAATASYCFTTLFAFPMEGLGTHRNCQCVTTSTAVIPPRLFQRVEILPPGANCRKTEILITKKDNKVVCIDPKAPWINKFFTRVMSK